MIRMWFAEDDNDALAVANALERVGATVISIANVSNMVLASGIASSYRIFVRTNGVADEALERAAARALGL